MNKAIKWSALVLVAVVAVAAIVSNGNAESTPITKSNAMAANHMVAGNYQLAPDLSSIGFATIKNQFVVEPATITALSGKLADDGHFEVDVNFSGLNTWIPIRDTRLQELFFKTTEHPAVQVRGKVNMDDLNKPASKMEIPAQVTMFGTTKEVVFPVVISTSGSHIMVASTHPVIVSGADFGIPASNLADLANTVNGIKISDAVPVTLNLMFNQM